MVKGLFQVLPTEVWRMKSEKVKRSLEISASSLTTQEKWCVTCKWFTQTCDMRKHMGCSWTWPSMRGVWRDLRGSLEVFLLSSTEAHTGSKMYWCWRLCIHRVMASCTVTKQSDHSYGKMCSYGLTFSDTWNHTAPLTGPNKEPSSIKAVCVSDLIWLKPIESLTWIWFAGSFPRISHCVSQ